MTTQTRRAQSAALSDEELRQLLPQADDFPSEVPPEIFRALLKTYEACERVDMRALAEKLGIARRTLYRKARDRNYLLGEMHWFYSRLFFCQGLRQAASLHGAARVVAVYEYFMNAAKNSAPLIKVLREEPENSLRLLTTKHGPVHSRVMDFMQRLLETEREQGHFQSSMPLDALAFAIVRIGESFLYAEVLTGEDPDVRFSVEMISRLLRPDQIKAVS